jgi:phage replication-related protein YjqB (UPF0714/DUF867 family)
MGLGRRELLATAATAATVAGGGCLGAIGGPPRTELTVSQGTSGPGSCLLPQQVAERLDAELGDQVRIGRPEAKACALFTVVGLGEVLAVTEEGRERLELPAGRTVAVEREIETPAEAPYAGTFTESVREGGTELLVCAPHGGEIEPRTDDQAERLARATDATAWICRGTWPAGGAFDRWHVTSTAVDPDSFPGLARVADRTYRYAVAFHGADSEGVRVGGGGPEALREELRDAIDEAVPVPVSLADRDEYRGSSLGNVVNRFAGAGIQLEAGRRAREEYGEAIVDRVASVLDAA